MKLRRVTKTLNVNLKVIQRTYFDIKIFDPSLEVGDLCFLLNTNMRLMHNDLKVFGK